MSEINTDIADLEQHLAENKEAVERRDALLRLTENRDYKRIFREEFMLQDCARFVQLSVNPALKAEDRADALAKSQAAGHLKQYLSVIVLQGNTAENSIVDIEAALDELRAVATDD